MVGERHQCCQRSDAGAGGEGTALGVRQPGFPAFVQLLHLLLYALQVSLQFLLSAVPDNDKKFIAAVAADKAAAVLPAVPGCVLSAGIHQRFSGRRQNIGEGPDRQISSLMSLDFVDFLKAGQIQCDTAHVFGQRFALILGKVRVAAVAVCDAGQRIRVDRLIQLNVLPLQIRVRSEVKEHEQERKSQCDPEQHGKQAHVRIGCDGLVELVVPEHGHQRSRCQNDEQNQLYRFENLEFLHLPLRLIRIDL